MRARRSHRTAWFTLARVFSGVLVGSSALGQVSPVDSATAQRLYDEGKRLMAEHNYGEACPKLEESQRLEPGSGTLLNLGDCYEHVGRFASAWGRFLEAASLAKSANQAERARVARERADAVLPRVSNVVFKVVGGDVPGFELKRDGAVVGKPQWGTPLPTDPGPHKVSASALNRKPWEWTFTVGAPGETTTISVPELESVVPTTETPPPINTGAEPTISTPGAAPLVNTQRIVAIGAAGVGVAGLVVGTVYGLTSKSKHDTAEAACPRHPACASQDQVELWDDARRAGNASTAAFVVGLVGVGAGVALWFTAPVPPGRAATQVGVGLDGVKLRGEW
jgi:hypothetical protein